MGYVLDETGTDGSECHRNLVSGRKVADIIRLLVVCNMSVQWSCMRLFLWFLSHDSETVVWRGRRDLE